MLFLVTILFNDNITKEEDVYVVASDMIDAIDTVLKATTGGEILNTRFISYRVLVSEETQN